MSKKRIARLRELAHAVTLGKDAWHEFTMRVPADLDRDADLVLSWAADQIAELTEALFGDNGALTRMDRARDVLKSRGEWQVLNTADIRQSLQTKDYAPLHDAENPTNMDAMFKASRELSDKNCDQS